MSRLYDRIRRYGTHDVSAYGEGEYGAWDASSDLARAIVLSADDVFAYFFSRGGPKEPKEWDVDRDVPNFAPPYPLFFVEGAMPNTTAPAWRQFSAHNREVGLKTVGALVRSRDFAHPAGDSPEVTLDSTSNPVLRAAFSPADLLRGPGYEGAPPPHMTGPVRWLVQARVYLEQSGHRRPLEGALDLFLAVRPDGSIARFDNGNTARINRLMPGTDERAASEISGALHYVTLPLFVAVAFTHCKNVRLTRTEPPAKLSRKHEKKTGKPLTTYHVLQIDPMKRVLEDEGRASEVGLRRAFHLCRGHFKRYTPERGGLFGRPIDEPELVWVDAHARGSTLRGTVEKDYRVRPAG